MSGHAIPELDHSYGLTFDMKVTPVTIVPSQEGVLQIETDQPLRLEFAESQEDISLLCHEVDAPKSPPCRYVTIPPTPGATGVTIHVSGPFVVITYDEHQEIIADRAALAREKIELEYVER